MGWFSSGKPPATVSVVSEFKSEEPKFLEDLPPKFEDNSPNGQTHALPPKQPTILDAAKQISLSDFTIDRFVHMPCFREAMITGFQAMGVLGVVTFLIHKNPQKSFNWSIGGFFLGNLVGWEQCRSLRRRSFEVMAKAKQAREEKNMKKWEELKGTKDEEFEKFQQFNNRKD
ncbi:cytochrome oxidase, 20 [Spathaspora passalidarum NRRL Y-27907]|uniref:Cytochrome c oxidase assembly protein COX20, mitochondrial n=1 Tax=Spathaspora passalidarum (strain NRRL Y-27907 / 11-Y1) TaxID=619300 RepID=G3AV33_SPAPN|nr:cytochrome oxidase, 20 [Spathaspora passalidarum NRRL Y-27907]EGW30107.1 cytochrome oxidase, 20 [Spathaspora passalidarum NRRL Y-27907]